jgi:hypothetical protein
MKDKITPFLTSESQILHATNRRTYIGDFKKEIGLRVLGNCFFLPLGFRFPNGDF